jgi:outer membrane protein
MKKVFVYIVLMVVYLNVNAQEILSVQDAIKQGLLNNYSIIIQKNEAAKTSNNYSPGNAGMLPTLDATVVQGNTIMDTRQEYATGNVVDRAGASSNSLAASADLNWTILDGFSMFVRYDRLKEFRNAGQINSRRTLENALQQIIEGYYNVVKQEALLQVLDSSRKISDIKLSVARTKFEIGAASKLPYLQSQVDRNADESAYKRQQVIVSQSKINLNQLLGRKVDIDFKTSDTIKLEEGFTLDKVLSSASVTSTDVLFAKSNLEISRLTIKEWRGQRFPFINLNAGYNFTRSSSEAGLIQENRSNGLNYGFTVRWNLFNGFNLNRNIRNAKLDYTSAEVNFNEIKSGVDAQVRVAFMQLQSNIEIINLERQNADLAKENIDLSIDRFRVGLTDELQFKEAQQSYVEALNRLVSSQYDALVAETTLKRLTGFLFNAD